MQSSKNTRIFGSGKGIDLSQNPQGRNALPFAANRKLDLPAEKQINSPFNGYVSSVST